MLFIMLLLLMTLLVVAFFSVSGKNLAILFLFAFATRFFLLVLNHTGVFVVPGGNADALAFEAKALALHVQPFFDILNSFQLSRGGTNYSALGAILVKLGGGNVLAMSFFNLFLGVFSTALISVLVLNIWGRKAAFAVALLLSLYPFSLFNSVIALREEISSYFGVLGAASVIYWSRRGSYYYLYLAAGFFLLAANFHPGWSGALVGLAAYSLWRSTQIVRLAGAGQRVSRYEFSLVMSAVVFVGGVAVLLSLPGFSVLSLFEGYVGEDADIGDAITARFAREEALGGSGYPSFITHGDPMTQPWLIPLRIFYFLFSPFPWDIRSPRQAMGLVSSLLYMFIFWKLYKHWDQVKQHKELIPILFIFAGLTFVFAIGVTNIGTAIRHKTKFFPILLLFGAVAFHKLKFKVQR